jgi:hypothetical protein
VHAAVVVPAFDTSDYVEARLKAPCSLSDTSGCATSAAIDKHSASMAAILACLQAQECQPFRNPSFGQWRLIIVIIK